MIKLKKLKLVISILRKIKKKIIYYNNNLQNI